MPIDRPDNRSFGYRLARLLHHVALSLSLSRYCSSSRIESKGNYFDLEREFQKWSGISGDSFYGD